MGKNLSAVISQCNDRKGLTKIDMNVCRNVKKNNTLENKKEILSNGSSLKPKPEIKKVGRPTGIKEKIKDKTTTLSTKTDGKLGAAKPGTALVSDLGRRVSARVKKPGKYGDKSCKIYFHLIILRRDFYPC